MDKNLLKEKVEEVFTNFKTAILQHSEINRKRADGGWSVGEIADHILKGTQMDLGSTKKSDRPYDQHADSIRELFLNFQMKFPAAPMLQPDSKLYSTGELMTLLDKAKNNLVRIIENDDLTETCIDIQLPVWGALTKYEWLILFINHIIRHTNQVNNFNKAAA